MVVLIQRQWTRCVILESRGSRRGRNGLARGWLPMFAGRMLFSHGRVRAAAGGGKGGVGGARQKKFGKTSVKKIPAFAIALLN